MQERLDLCRDWLLNSGIQEVDMRLWRLVSRYVCF